MEELIKDPDPDDLPLSEDLPTKTLSRLSITVTGRKSSSAGYGEEKFGVWEYPLADEDLYTLMRVCV